MNKRAPGPAVEWPTVSLVLQSYTGIAVAVFLIPQLSLFPAVALLALSITLHSSLQHETIHGHPVRPRWLAVALVWLPVGLLVPYERFRDQHLAHHRDNRLTDPYDDPETGYFDPAVWNGLPRWLQLLLRFNNSLAGRLTIGPAISEVMFIRGDWRAWRAGQRGLDLVWGAHLAAVAAVLAIVGTLSPMPLWAYATGAYIGMSLLKIRTYLEHQAHEHAGGRTVIVEDGGILSFLFLNNNYHAVHHAKPNIAWYDLPRVFSEDRERWLQRNQGYYFRNYGEVFRNYFFRAKEPVPHPLMEAGKPE
jgi:fatty acid desaturase